MKIKRIILLVSFLAGTILFMVWHSYQLFKDDKLNQHLQYARMYTRIVLSFRKVYTDETIRLTGKHNLHDFSAVKDENLIPLPITITKNIMILLSENHKGSAEIISPYDFSGEDKKIYFFKDRFSKEAWEYFSKNQGDEYYEIESGDDGDLFRYASPDRMSGSCIQCHNQLAAGRTQWNESDLAGLIEYRIPLYGKASGENSEIFLTLIFYMMLAFTSLLIILFFMSREYFRTKDLEHIVQTRTEELVLAKEEAEKANHAKSEFLSRMSHELRTPLNAILGFSQIMITESPSSEINEYSRQILSSGKHLLELINEILELSKIEIGKVDLEMVPVVVEDTIENCINMIFPFADTHGIHLINQTDPREKNIALADKKRLRQILLNLISNAIKYSKEKGTVTIQSEKLENGKIRISIADSGSGLDEEMKHKIFQPFERGKASNSSIQGTGIGLTISRELIHKMGGSIGFESQENIGSVFWIELNSDSVNAS
ncbi:MAG: ATP-binding protein [Spirochaetia bacterium]|nr:ATP-binding protein [Spirochaetia bacterium]